MGDNHRQPLVNMAKNFIWLEETKERINDFLIGYMINSALNINNAFKEKVTKCMKTKFGETTQPHIRNILAKNNTRVLALLMFYETINNPHKIFKFLSCVIYKTIRNYVCIDYLACESKKLSGIPVSFGGGFIHGNKSYEKILGIRIPYLLMNLMYCHDFLKNINPIVILKYPKRMLE